MSSPGGPGNWGHYEHGREQYYDPITGQPVNSATSAGHGPPPGNAGHQPYSSGSRYSGSQYQGFGVFEQTQRQPHPDLAPRSSGRKPVIVTMAIAAVVVAGIVTTVVVASGGGSRERAHAGSAGSTPTSATTSEAPAIRSSEPTTNPTSAASPTEDVIEPVPPVVPGWQGMGVLEIGVAYDVPQGWVAKPGVVTGFENDSGERVAMTNFSGYMEDFCPSSDVSYRARVGTIDSHHADPVVAAEDAIRKWARIGWTSDTGRQPEVVMNPVRTVTLRAGNNTEATLVSATITPPTPGPCGTERMYISVLGLRTDGNAALLLGMADQGAPGAVAPAEIDKALTSLRPLPE